MTLVQRTEVMTEMVLTTVFRVTSRTVGCLVTATGTPSPQTELDSGLATCQQNG